MMEEGSRQIVLANEMPGITRLSTPAKTLLVEDLWYSIASDQLSIPALRSHREESD
jgi:hypothetical protein